MFVQLPPRAVAEKGRRSGSCDADLPAWLVCSSAAYWWSSSSVPTKPETASPSFWLDSACGHAEFQIR